MSPEFITISYQGIVLKTFSPNLDMSVLYDSFNEPITEIDCGVVCAPHNPNGVPFCCDICYAVPAAYQQEWRYLRAQTDLWHVWQGDECVGGTEDPEDLKSITPEHMILLACKGVDHCQRMFRAMSCRQFPFFPYITEDHRFLGMAYEWAFENTCWVISNLGTVREVYWRGFIALYDSLLAIWPDEHESYAIYSKDMREVFAAKKWRIPILHRNGGYYLLSPGSERLVKATPQEFRKFGPYANFVR